MTFFALVGRLLMNFALSPTGRNIMKAAGRYAVRQGQAALIRAVRSGNRKIEIEKIR